MSADQRLEQVQHTGKMAADTAFMAARGRGETMSTCVGAAVNAALECALGNRLIQITDQATWPELRAIDPPYNPDGAPWA